MWNESLPIEAGYWSITTFRELAADSEVSTLLKTRERERLRGTPFPPKPSLLNPASRKNPFHACKQNDFEGRINIAFYFIILSSWLVKAYVVIKKIKSFILSSGKKRQEKDQPFSLLNKVKKPIRLPLESLNTLPSAPRAFHWSFRIHTECEMFPRPSKWCLTYAAPVILRKFSALVQSIEDHSPS